MNRLSRVTMYPITVDCVIFGYKEGELMIALIERKNPPFKGSWAIPGGFIEGDETVEEGAIRELKEETGIDDIYLEQFHVFSKPKRDPRGRVITVAFFALINSEQFELVANEDAAKAQWWSAYDLPHLAFDHALIFEKALEALRNTIRIKPIAFELLPKYFTLTQLQLLYEQIFGMKIDKRNFRKKIQKLEYIRSSGKLTKGGRHRPAMLYQFNLKLYRRIQ